MGKTEVYVFPMTPQQRRLWVIDRIRPGNPAYNVPLALQLHGAVDVTALADALAGLVARHEILRTTFGELDGELVQLVHESAPFALEQTDLDAPGRASLAEQLAEDSRQPFDLVRGPLFRARLYRLGAREHVLFLNLHHITCDRWSLGIVAGEVMTGYNALVARRGESPQPPEYQYSDYGEWLRERLAPDRMHEHVEYWREALAGLPSWRLPQIAGEGPGDTVSRELSRKLGKRVAAFARGLGATPYMVLLAAFAALLYRYRAGDDLAIGTPVANREHRAFADTVGLFVNTVVVRVACSDSPSLRALTEKVRERAIAAFAHQEVPFDVVTRELRPGRGHDGRSSLFQAMFALQNTRIAPLELVGLEVTPMPMATRAVKNELTLMLEQDEGPELRATLEFAPRVFSRSRAAQFLDHYAQLLTSAVASPDVPLARMRLLSAAERRAETVEVNPLDRYPGTNRTLVEWFEQSAKAHGERTAICDTRGRPVLDYRGLDERANRLARRLKELGVGRESRVGLCLGREPELIVAIIAVLKAGGCYVPLDPGYPAERMALLLGDSGVEVVVCKREHAKHGFGDDVHMVVLDEPGEADAIGQQSAARLGLTIAPEQAAYVIYTSGSTGRPKGCVVQHGNVTALMESAQQQFEFGPEDVWTMFHSYAFDFAVWEVWGALLHGGRLVVVPWRVSRSPQEFATLVRECGVTVLNQTPSAFWQVMEGLWDGGHRLRAIVFGGEKLEIPRLERWYERHDEHRPLLVNMYGITETTVHVTYRALGPEDARAGGDSVIGAPLGHLRAYVLDEWMEPVPRGVTGELYVGGAGVSRGYLGQPELTAARFVPDPYGNEAGGRLYRTGDLARRLEDGTLVYQGRADHQVKVRGFRIEPGEIQATLCTHPEVVEALVVPDSGGDGQEVKRLVAYVVAGEDEKPAAGALREFLLARLPEYMVPQAYVMLEGFPLNHNGKLDRAALPAPEEQAGDGAGEKYVAPRTETERQLAAIWQGVLGLPRVGATDNFFTRGGDSILALQVVSRARADGIHLTPQQIFEHQTITALSRAAGTSVGSLDEPEGDAGLTPIQHWFFSHELVDAYHWNQSIVLWFEHAPSANRLEEALAGLVAIHPSLRTRFVRRPSGWYQRVVPDGSFPLALSRGDLDIAIAAVQTRLDLFAGPVAAAVLVPTPGRSSAHLVLAVHHLVIDGVSWRILADDLEALLDRPEVALPRPSVTCTGWAERLAREATSPATVAELEYWTEVEASGTVRLPRSGHGDGRNTEADAITVTTRVDRQATELLLRHAPRAQRATAQEILVAALAQTMQEAVGSRLRIALEGQGREELDPGLDLSRTTGWLTSLYPFRLPEVGDDAVRAIKAAKEAVRGVPRGGLGYGLLRYLHPDPDIRSALAALPGPELSFNYLGRVADVRAGSARLVRTLPIPERGGGNRRPFALDVAALVVGDQLELSWTFHPALHSADTVQRWADRFRDRLHALLDTAIGTPAIPSPVDYPLADLDESALNALSARYRDQPAIEDIRALTPMQEGMLFHAVDGGTAGLYVEQITGLIRGELDITAFTGAWNDAIARHRVLRTAIEWRAGSAPCQVILSEAAIPFHIHDWRRLDEDPARERFDEFLDNDRAHGIDLAQPPLMRLHLIRHDDRLWRWLWTHHHVVLDGWSLPILFDEVMRCYEARVVGKAVELPPPVDAAAYHRWLARQAGDDNARWWREWLHAVPVPQRIEGGRRPDEPAQPAGEVEHSLNSDERRRMEAFARAHGVTVSTVLLGAWLICLSRHGAGVHPLVGVTVAGRPAAVPDADRMVGLFINTLPVSHAVDPAAPMVTWLQELQSDQSRLREREHCRLIDIRRWAGWDGDTAPFESLFVFENYPVSESLRRAAAGIAVEDIEFLERTNFPLTVAAIPGPQFVLKINFDGDRFHRAAATALLERFYCLVMAMSKGGSQRVGELAALTDAERAALVGPWAERTGPIVGPEPAQAAFERHAKARPEAIAIDDGERTVTYAALDRDARRLASRLRRIGVGRETVVALLLPRSAELIAVMLGVLEAGGAWLPLDPLYPEARLSEMLTDSGARYLVCRGQPPDSLAQTVGVVVELDKPDDEPDELDEPPVHVDPDQLAYVIYTSGSTGKPKGVLVPHAGVANNAYQHAIAQGVDGNSRVYQFASPSFDAAVAEIFTAFTAGATLCLPAAAALEAADPLVSLTAARATHVTLPPSVAAVLAPSDVPELRCLTLAGEACTGALVRRFTDHCRVINAYGPTEVTVCATLEDCTELDGEPLLGWPMPGKRIYVIDDRGDLVPPGVPGEIAIGGLGTARGYHGRPALTATVFVPDRFSGQPGARLYRTGDLGVRLADGRIHYAGRVDRQIKLRGFRIEPGEIEAAAATHPAVQQAVAHLHRPEAGPARLVVHVQADPERCSEEALLDWLAARVPPQARPAHAVFVTEWPRLPSGKIAIAALPQPALPVVERSRASTEVEQMLIDIWAQVLGRAVAPHDNFFRLGGDSITSLQVVARAREAGVALTPRQIFENPTVADLGPHVTISLAAHAAPEPLQGPVALSPIQSWFFGRELATPTRWNQSVALALDEPLDAERLARGVAAATARHDAFRLRFGQRDGVWHQHYTAAAEARFEVFDLTHLDPVEASCAMDRQADRVQGSFDLERGPLCAVALFRLPAGARDCLLVTAHHLVVDVVSWRRVLEDLIRGYEGQRLPTWRGSSFRRWTERLSEAARDGLFDGELPYWKHVLEAARPHLCDATGNALGSPSQDHGTASSGTASSEERIGEIDRDRTRWLLARGGAWARDVLLTALMDAMHEVVGVQQLCVDVESHGRAGPWDDLDVAASVGWFTALYPVRLDHLAGADAQARVEAMASAVAEVPRHGLGFGVLAEIPPASDAAPPLADAPPREIGFNYLGELDAGHALPRGFTLLPSPPGRDTGDERPAHPLELDAAVSNDTLRLRWRFDPGRIAGALVADLAAAYDRALARLSSELPTFEKARFGADELADILHELDE